MATYIPGISDYIPQIQPFVPDYNFLSNVLQTKQSRYDQSRKQIGEFYGNLLNSPMVREDNLKRRDDFFKSVDSQIKKLSGIDLSLQQNQDYAMQIFKPFYEDQGIIKDMSTTKSYMSQKERANTFKTGCLDPEKCGGAYWKGGEDYLDYKIDEFKNLSADEALSFQNPTYVADPMLQSKAFKNIVDNKIGIKYDHVSNGWIVTEENGEPMIGTLNAYLQSAMAHQPGVMDYYQVKAYLERKNHVAENTQSMGSAEEAEASYQSTVLNYASKELTQNNQDAEAQATSIAALRKTIEKNVRTNGILPNEKERIDGYISIIKQQELAEQRKAYTSQTVGLIKNASNNSDNKKILTDRTDQIVAAALLNRDLGAIAKEYSLLTYKKERKVDPYALAQVQSNLSLNNALTLEGVKQENWKERKMIEDQIENQVGMDFMGEPIFRPEGKGSAQGPETPNKASIDNQDLTTKLTEKVNGGITNYLSNMVNTMQASFSSSSITPEQQQVLKDSAKEIFKNSGLDSEKLLAGDMTELDKLSEGQYKMIDMTYKKALELSDPNKGAIGLANSFWNKSFYQTALPQKMEISKNQISKSIFDKDMEGASQQVIKDLVSDYSASGDDLKGFLAKSMLGSVNGKFIPSVKNEEDLKTQAIIFAEKYGENLFGDKEEAKKYAMKHAEDVAEDWEAKYGAKVKSYAHALGGKRSNAEVGGAYDMKFDLNYRHENNYILQDLLGNFDRVKDKAIVSYGDGSEIRKDDAGARQVITDFIADYKSPKKGKTSNIGGNFIVQNVTGEDPNFMSFTVFPTEQWAKTHAGTKNKEGSTYDDMYKNGVNITIPTQFADSDYYRNTKIDEWDYILDKKGEIVVDTIPSGNLTLQKHGNTYAINGELRVAQPDGSYKPVLITPPDLIRDNLDASDVYDTWTKLLMTLEIKNQQVLSGARSEIGIKDMNELLQELSNPDGKQQF